MLDDANDVFEEDPDVYCDMTWRKNAVRQRLLSYTCFACSIIRERSQNNIMGACCGSSVNHYTENLTKWHQHLDTHRARGEAVPQEYYEMRIIP
jgi:hypothetical protein